MARIAPLRDPYGRALDYLRLSVTDRCNLRCAYCLPESAADFSPAAESLSDDEVVFLAGCFARLGFSRVRLTGGEPLVRTGLPELVARLSRLPGVKDLSLSTNGILLADLAAPLAAVGLGRVNISLDTLEPGRFKGLARFGNLPEVLRGIEAALDAGLSPVKLNTVVIRGSNEDEVAALAALTDRRPLHVRFIELMPMGETGFYSPERLVPMVEIMRRAGPLEVLPSDDRPRGGGPARYYRRPGARGTIGVISALSCGFCADCNRVRLSTVGKLIPCLDGMEGEDLAGPLRAGASPEEIQGRILAVVARKPERHFMLERSAPEAVGPRSMCSIGG